LHDLNITGIIKERRTISPVPVPAEDTYEKRKRDVINEERPAREK